jgi:hypothetical protein
MGLPARLPLAVKASPFRRGVRQFRIRVIKYIREGLNQLPVERREDKPVERKPHCFRVR